MKTKNVKIFAVRSKKCGNQTVIIDADDWPSVQEYEWHVAHHGGEVTAIVARTWGGGKRKTKQLKLHHLIMRPVLVGTDVCHLDGNVLNNRKTNLFRCKTYNRKPVIRRGKPVRYKGEKI